MKHPSKILFHFRSLDFHPKILDYFQKSLILALFPYLCTQIILDYVKSLIPKLQTIKQRYNEVADLIIQPDVITDQKRYGQLNKEYSDLEKIVKVLMSICKLKYD